MCEMMRREKYLEHVSLNPAFRIHPVDVNKDFLIKGDFMDITYDQCRHELELNVISSSVQFN
jgi:hypothetical protein